MILKKCYRRSHSEKVAYHFKKSSLSICTGTLCCDEVIVYSGIAGETIITASTNNLLRLKFLHQFQADVDEADEFFVYIPHQFDDCMTGFLTELVFFEKKVTIIGCRCNYDQKIKLAEGLGVALIESSCGGSGVLLDIIKGRR